MKYTPAFLGLRMFLVATLFGSLLPSARATTVLPPDFDQLVNEADYIIRAVVKNVTAEHRTDAHGRKIITKVSLEIREVVAGSPPTEVVLEMLGGKIGDEQMVVEGAPRFRVGDEDILFVRGNGRTIVPLVAMMHGRYPVIKEPATERMIVARENSVPLRGIAEIAQPLSAAPVTGSPEALAASVPALTPEEFIRQIKLAVNPHYVRAKL